MFPRKFSARFLRYRPENMLRRLSFKCALHHALRDTQKGSNLAVVQPDCVWFLGKVLFAVPKVVGKLVKLPLKQLHIELFRLVPGQARQLQYYSRQGRRRPEHWRGGGGREMIKEGV